MIYFILGILVTILCIVLLILKSYEPLSKEDEDFIEFIILTKILAR